MSNQNYKFQGWLGHDDKAVEGNMKFEEFEPKKWEETDVDIKITHCGICGSDIHTLRSGWGESLYPVCVGHEVVGTVVRVGSKAEGHVKVGDRCGVGAQCGSCVDCEYCADGFEEHCAKRVDTYNDKYQNGDKTYGGYGDYIRVPSHFAIPIPKQLSSAVAAPMLCAGITVFNPLKTNGVGPGKVAAISGLGGLGHLGVQFAKALGADKVVVISRSSKKKEDALKLGADDFIATEEDSDWAEKHAGTIDVIVNTVSSPDLQVSKLLGLLKTFGKFVQVGAPEDNIPAFSAFDLIGHGVAIGGSRIGGVPLIKEMLDLAVEKGVKTWIEERPLSEANKAVQDFTSVGPRYRYVLVNEKHAKEEGAQ